MVTQGLLTSLLYDSLMLGNTSAMHANNNIINVLASSDNNFNQNDILIILSELINW